MKFRFRLLLVAFSVSFILVAALSTLSISRFSQLRERVDSVEHSYHLVNVIDVLDEQVRELDMNEFRFLVTKDSSFFYGYEKAAIRVKKATDSLRALTRDNPTQQAFIVLFGADMTLFHQAALNAIRTPVSADSIMSSASYQQSRLIMASAAQRLTQMTAEERGLLRKRTLERQSFQDHTDNMIKTLSAVFGLLTLILFFLLLSELRKRLKYQATLQQKMVEIAQSKQELEHIAYATSHDLQEPLRKIRILTDKWQHRRNEPLPEDTGDTLNRVAAAAKRMQELVSELMVLTTLNDDAKRTACPLNDHFGIALRAVEDQIIEKGARIDVEKLPVINGYPDQLSLLFKNMLDNALKFARPGEQPLISVTVRKTDSVELEDAVHTDRQYYCITIKDNGIGFDNKMADKMFGIFRQLHTVSDGVVGKGTGLAICQRIMSNHKGRIIAHGFPNTGATFKLYFPIGS